MSGVSTHPQEGDGERSEKKQRIVRIINSVIDKVEKAEGVSREAIYHELKDLQHIIEESRREIAMARPKDISDKDIPGATDELDAVVEATAQATGSIMDACDVISDKAMEIGGDGGDAIMDQVTKIYESCSFQDITGQRITKVVKTLKSIEETINKLTHIMEEKMPGLPDHEPEMSYEESLLNGPQLPGQAISQDDIDKLLAEFGD
ncbi:MAG: protein phosphatase CheZ [Alphaproteobacteria bacterium]|nr:protein phosphatase CheZ [Alphaproteobacteria bacterium]